MSFKEVIGHQTPISLIRNCLREKRLGLTYLFHGPSGVGKAFVARQFAKGINCEKGEDDCCDNCSPCLRQDKLAYPDLHWLDLESGSNTVKIEQIRLLQEAVCLRPFEGRAKVFVINNCQGLSEEAANCLLKVTEEPPSDSLIILISSCLGLVLPTIASRSQKIKFSPLPRRQVEEVLKRNLADNPQEVKLLCSHLSGRIGQAFTWKGRDFLSLRDAVIKVFLSGSRQENIFKDRDYARVALSILAGWYRDLLLIKSGLGDESLINQDKSALAIQEASRYSYPEIILILRNISSAFDYLEQNINLRLLADSLWLNIQRWKN